MNCFLEAAKAGNISRAAENLFISQQALSYQLNALEKELGFRVFIRRQKGVSLTGEGQLLFEDWLDAMEKIRISVDKARDMHKGRKKQIRIGMEDVGNCSEDIMNGIFAYREKYKDLDVEVEMMSPRSMLVQLDSGNLDLGILYGSEFDMRNSLRCLPLHDRHVKICMFMAKNHPLAGKKDLTIGDLSEETIGILSPDVSFDFRRQVCGFFEASGAAVPKKFKEFSSRRDLEIALISGGCVTIVYETMFIGEKHKLFSKEVQGKFSSSRIEVFWKKEDMDTKARSLADLLKERLKKFDQV